MREDLQDLHGLGQFHHPQGSFYIALYGLVQSRVEVDTGSAVQYYVAILYQLMPVFLAEAKSVLM